MPSREPSSAMRRDESVGTCAVHWVRKSCEPGKIIGTVQRVFGPRSI
jgi:hypothetical protein